MSVLSRCVQLNSINFYIFADATKDLLARGRDKFLNVMIVGLANSQQNISVKET